MDEERKMILKMLQDGKIDADQAAKLIEALDKSESKKGKAKKEKEEISDKPGKWFRVRITDTDTEKIRANIRIPIGVIDAGFRMGAKFAPQLDGMDSNEILRAINERWRTCRGFYRIKYSIFKHAVL